MNKNMVRFTEENLANMLKQDLIGNSLNLLRLLELVWIAAFFTTISHRMRQSVRNILSREKGYPETDKISRRPLNNKSFFSALVFFHDDLNSDTKLVICCRKYIGHFSCTL